MNAPNGLFDQINNTLLDLQRSDLNTYQAHIKKLGRLLQHEDFLEYRTTLTESVDFDKFIADSEKTHRGMGGAELAWPEDDQQILALQLILVLKFAENPQYMGEIGYRFLWPGGKKVMNGVHAVISQIIIPFVRDFKNYVIAKGSVRSTLVLPISNKVFIVHGHDGEARETVARFLGNIGFDPIILNEQANQGRTIIEKVEANADVGFAVVLLTPDDMGRAKDSSNLEPRARQNVLLELGYFMAKLGRNKVCALRRGEVSIPSDFAGVVWEDMDLAGGWKQKLGRELQAAGHHVDWNNIMR